MARPLSNALQIARHVLFSAEAWLLFVRIPRAAGGEYRLVRSARNVIAGGVAWQASSIEIPDLPEESLDGDLPKAALVIPNVSRIPMAAVEVDDELVGATLTFSLGHTTALEVLAPGLTWEMTCLAAECDETSVRLDLGHPAAIARVPSRVFSRREFPQLLPTGGR